MNNQPFYNLPDNNIFANLARRSFLGATIAPGSSAETKSTEFSVRQALSAFAIQSAADSGQLFLTKSEVYPASLLLQAEGTGAVETGGTINGVYEYIIPLNQSFVTDKPMITHARFIPFGYISGHANNFLRPDGTFRWARYGVI